MKYLTVILNNKILSTALVFSLFKYTKRENLIWKLNRFNYYIGKYVKICMMCFGKSHLAINFEISWGRKTKKNIYIYIFLEEDIVWRISNDYKC